jgi:DNA invertase Pin-like site-specific DNA recombinase
MTDIAGKWLRVSTSGQDEANQEPDIDKWIADHGYGVGPTYQLHGKSASKGEQDSELEKVIADMTAGVINVLVVWHSSRIERRGAESVFDLARKVRGAHGRIEYVQDSHLNETNDLSDVMLALAASQNKQYSQNISKQTVAGFKRIDANGAIRNKAGYGHRVVADGEKYAKRFELDDAEADVIRLAVNRYLAGMPLAHVCRMLTSNGHRGRKGAAWTPKTLGTVFRSEHLIGRFHQGDTVARCPTIITVKQFNDVQARLDAKAYRKGVRTRPDTALLTSILFCGKCERPMYRFTGRANQPVSYYCRPVAGVPSCKMLIELQEADEMVIGDFGRELYVNYRTQEKVIPGHDYADDIAQLVLDIKALDPTEPGWLATVTEMQSKISRLALLDPEPDVVVTVDVDTVAEAQAWDDASMADKRAALLDAGAKLYASKDDDGRLVITRR